MSPANPAAPCTVCGRTRKLPKEPWLRKQVAADPYCSRECAESAHKVAEAEAA